MSNTFRTWTVLTMASLVIVVGASLTAMSFSLPPQVLFQEPSVKEVHLTSIAGQRLELKEPDPAILYIVDAGSDVLITRAMTNPERTRPVRVIVRGQVEAHGTNVDITAEPGSAVTAYDGVVVEATGAKVTVRGNVRLKAFAGTVVHNYGNGEENAYDGSITYARTRGRVFAWKGATVYAKSPENCDACTQVAMLPGSLIYIYDGAEAFGKLATAYVYKGGEVGCARNCTLYLQEGAEFNYGPNCKVFKLPDAEDDHTPDPFDEE